MTESSRGKRLLRRQYDSLQAWVLDTEGAKYLHRAAGGEEKNARTQIRCRAVRAGLTLSYDSFEEWMKDESAATEEIECVTITVTTPESRAEIALHHIGLDRSPTIQIEAESEHREELQQFYDMMTEAKRLEPWWNWLTVDKALRMIPAVGTLPWIATGIGIWVISMLLVALGAVRIPESLRQHSAEVTTGAWMVGGISLYICLAIGAFNIAPKYFPQGTYAVGRSSKRLRRIQEGHRRLATGAALILAAIGIAIAIIG